MARDIYRRIIALVLKAAEMARSVGIANLLQPGLVKEMIIADILGHDLIHSKRDADAHASNRPTEKYEYLSCKEGGTGQLDRMFKAPEDKRAESLNRITRNHKIYFAVFYAVNQTKCKIIYEIEPQVVVEEVERQLDRSRNAISHVGFSENWASQQGRVVYRDEAYSGLRLRVHPWQRLPTQHGADESVSVDLLIMNTDTKNAVNHQLSRLLLVSVAPA